MTSSSISISGTSNTTNLVLGSTSGVITAGLSDSVESLVVIPDRYCLPYFYNKPNIVVTVLPTTIQTLELDGGSTDFLETINLTSFTPRIGANPAEAVGVLSNIKSLKPSVWEDISGGEALPTSMANDPLNITRIHFIESDGVVTGANVFTQMKLVNLNSVSRSILVELMGYANTAGPNAPDGFDPETDIISNYIGDLKTTPFVVPAPDLYGIWTIAEISILGGPDLTIGYHVKANNLYQLPLDTAAELDNIYDIIGYPRKDIAIETFTWEDMEDSDDGNSGFVIHLNDRALTDVSAIQLPLSGMRITPVLGRAGGSLIDPQSVIWLKFSAVPTASELDILATSPDATVVTAAQLLKHVKPNTWTPQLVTIASSPIIVYTDSQIPISFQPPNPPPE